MARSPVPMNVAAVIQNSDFGTRFQSYDKRARIEKPHYDGSPDLMKNAFNNDESQIPI